MNIFIHHRDLRYHDNTSMIEQIKNCGKVTPIFVFDPRQIDQKQNKYFSSNLVQFMVESIRSLQKEYKKKGGQLYTFKGDYIKILNSIHRKTRIQSVGFNLDYSPFAKKRDSVILKWCKKNDVEVYAHEDMLLHPVMEGGTVKKNGEPYKVFTPFKRALWNTKVKPVNNFRSYSFKKAPQFKKNKYYFVKMSKLYEENENLVVEGGRKWALNRLKGIKKFSKYNKCRDVMSYETTQLSASLNFNVVSIREVYHTIAKKLGKKNKLVNELFWRDFYYNILYYFPHIIKGSFKEKYDKIKWSKSSSHFKKWCEGRTGFPLVDACMRQMNQTGFMHNRGRMIVSSFLIKNLWVDWRKGEKYFAQNLTDYNISANNGGWQWSSGGGTDAQPYFRIFNVWSQSAKYDPQCEYIKKWVPELENVPPKDIHKWNEKHLEYRGKDGVDYPKPMVDHTETRNKAIKLYKKYLR